MPGLDALVVQRSHNFETRKHTKRTIVPTALRHGIKVRPEDYWWYIVRTVSPPDHVAEVIGSCLQASFLEPRTEQVSGGTVLIGESQPGDTSIGSCAELPHF